MKAGSTKGRARKAVFGLLLGFALVVPLAVAAPPETPAPKPHAFSDDLMPYGYARLLHGTALDPARQKVEAMADAGLTWLAAHQSPDGRFAAHGFADLCHGEPFVPLAKPGRGDALHDAGTTALALAAFLQAGYTHRGNHQHARMVRRGLRWLLSVQDADGVFGGQQGETWIHAHALATYTLINAYGMTGSALLRSSAQRGLDVLAALETSAGGWGYGITRQKPNAGATALAMLPIQSAMYLGLAAEKVGRRDPFTLRTTATPWLWFGRNTRTGSGRVGYSKTYPRPMRYGKDFDRFPAKHSEAPSAAALLFYSGAMRRPEPPEHENWGTLVRKARPRWLPNTGTVDLVYWWFGAMAMHRDGRRSAREWIEDLEAALAEGQRTDTSVCRYRGSWDPVGVWGKAGGRVYATAVSVLALLADRSAPMGHGHGPGLTAERIAKLTPERRVLALRSLDEYPGSDGYRAAAQALEDPDPRFRRLGAVMLGRLGQRVKRRAPVELLIRLSRGDEAADVRRAAIWAMGNFGEKHKRVRPVLSRIAKTAEEPVDRFLAGLSRSRSLRHPHPAKAGLLGHVRDPEMLLELAARRGVETGFHPRKAGDARGRALARRLHLPPTLQDPLGTAQYVTFARLFRSPGVWRDKYDALLVRLDDPEASYTQRLEALGSGLRACRLDGSPSRAQLDEAGLRSAVLRVAFVRKIRAERAGEDPADAATDPEFAQAIALLDQVRTSLREAREKWDRGAFDIRKAEAAMLWLEAEYLGAWFEARRTGDLSGLRTSFTDLDTSLWVFDGTRAARHLMIRKALQLRDFAEDVVDVDLRASLYEGVLLLLDHAASGDPRDPAERRLMVRSFGARARTCLEARRIGATSYLRRGRAYIGPLQTAVPDLGADPLDHEVILPMARLLNAGGDQRRAVRFLLMTAKRATLFGNADVSAASLRLRADLLAGR